MKLVNQFFLNNFFASQYLALGVCFVTSTCGEENEDDASKRQKDPGIHVATDHQLTMRGKDGTFTCVLMNESREETGLQLNRRQLFLYRLFYF